MIDSFHQCGDAVAGFLWEPECFSHLGADSSDHPGEFQSKRAFLLGLGYATALEKMPDLFGEAAGHRRHRDVAVTFAHEEAPAPVAQFAGPGLLAHHRLGGLDQQATHLLAAPVANSRLKTLARPALLPARVQSEIIDKLPRTAEASDVADDGHGGKGVDRTDAQDAQTPGHRRIGEHLLADGRVEGFTLRYREGETLEVPGPASIRTRSPA